MSRSSLPVVISFLIFIVFLLSITMVILFIGHFPVPNRTQTDVTTLNNQKNIQLICGSAKEFEDEPWFPVMMRALSTQPVITDEQAYLELRVAGTARQKAESQSSTIKDIKKQYGTFSLADIRDMCVIPSQHLTLTIAGNYYCNMGALFRFDQQKSSLERVYYPARAGCTESLSHFEPRIIDGMFIPLRAAFGDAGVYFESRFYYDFKHNLFALQKRRVCGTGGVPCPEQR